MILVIHAVKSCACSNPHLLPSVPQIRDPIHLAACLPVCLSVCLRASPPPSDLTSTRLQQAPWPPREPVAVAAAWGIGPGLGLGLVWLAWSVSGQRRLLESICPDLLAVFSHRSHQLIITMSALRTFSVIVTVCISSPDISPPSPSHNV